MKKILALALALIMVLGLATTASAAEVKNTITITSDYKGATYVAYQVFKGDIDATSGQLTNITWGAGVDGPALLADLKANVTAFKDCVTVVDVATVISGMEKDAELAKTFAAYVSKHLTSTVAGTSTETASPYTIEVTGDGYYFIKNTTAGTTEENGDASFTRFILKVAGNVTVAHKGEVPSVDKQIVDSTTTETGDYSIGDTITYQLIGTLPSNYADYKTYQYIFHDTLTSGLDYTDKSVKVTLDTAEGTDITDMFTVTYENHELTISCSNLKTNTSITASSKIVVTYTAVLNKSAVVGGEGNPNDVYLEFSNDPNWDNSGEKEPTGETPEDEVVVFTFELDVTKVDGVDNNIKLEGAEFKLQNADDKWVVVDGDSKVTGWADTQDAGSVLTSDENGFFKIVGLEDGTYNLVETKAPTGYNKLDDPIVITITSTYDEDGVKTLTITVGEETKNGDTTNGTVATTVKNNSGAVLPETGGMGTTIFYIIGGLLVAAAVVLLVTKKRMTNAA